MEAYKDIVTAIKEYNVQCKTTPDCQPYDMRWSIDVGLEYPIDDEWWTADIQFRTWGDYKQGVIFYKQVGGVRTMVTPTQTDIDRFVCFFDINERDTDDCRPIPTP